MASGGSQESWRWNPPRYGKTTINVIEPASVPEDAGDTGSERKVPFGFGARDEVEQTTGTGVRQTRDRSGRDDAVGTSDDPGHAPLEPSSAERSFRCMLEVTSRPRCSSQCESCRTWSG